MDAVFKKLNELSNQRRNYALCIVTHTEGSSPRKAGSKMIVYEDGYSEGTIGGGGIEKRVIDECAAIIKAGFPVKRVFDLEEDLGMHCGGLMEIYIEPVKCAPSLFIFGAGHIGNVLSKFAAEAGFSVTIFDNRKEILDSYDNPSFNYIGGDYFEAIENAYFDDDTYVVIVTHRHVHDEDILAAVARKPHAYLGMIGSRVKVQSARLRFISENILTEEELNSIDMPIGIPIKVETPAEIAISILAKLIDVKNLKYKNA